MTEENQEVSSGVDWKDSLVTRVNGVTIIILIILISILGFIINSIVSEEITKSAQERNIEIANSLQKEATSFFGEGAEVMRMLSYNQEVTEVKIDEMKELFAKVEENNSYFRTIYLGTTTGKMHAYPEIELPDDYDPTKRPWYTKAKQENNVVWSDVYIDSDTNKPIITAAVPITNTAGEVIGVLGGDVSLDTLSNAIVNRKIGQDGYAFMINGAGELLAHPDQEKVEDNFDLTEVFDTKSVLEKKQGHLEYQFNGANKLASYVHVPTIDGAIIAQVPFEEVYQAREEIRGSILLFSFIIIVVLSLVIYFINKKYLLEPIKRLTTQISKIAHGDFTVETTNNRKDELGSLETALANMTNSLRDVMVNLSETIEDLSAYSQELSASAEEGNATIETTNDLIENMSSGIQQISASAEEVTSFAQESNSQTEVGRDKIEMTVDNIKEINQSVTKTVAIINDLDETSEEIGQIVELITNIAEQTNLLALNAAIEAARAGEHGQGFAVVADEIRELAEDTSDATDKISHLINKTQEKSQTGLKAINEVQDKAEEGQKVAEETGQVFARIEESAEETSAQIEQTASATQELAQNSDEISTAAGDIENMSEEISNSSQELASMAQKLQGLIEEFKV
jgi:methyl-accepting chemotaxis protein